MPVTRLIVEVGPCASHLDDVDQLRDLVTDALIEELNTPNVQVLDVIQEGAPNWQYGTSFR